MPKPSNINHSEQFMPPTLTPEQLTGAKTESAASSLHSSKPRRFRKRAQDIAAEKVLISQLLTNGMPLLEVQIRLELTETQLRGHLATLLRDGFRPPLPQYEVVLAKNLPLAIRKKLHTQDHELIKFEGNNNTVTLQVI